MADKVKAGFVTIIGRPSVGKSTLINSLLKQKVSITSPKPQTTRIPVQGIYHDDKGQIILTDTPGVFEKVEGQVSKKINPIAEQQTEGAQVILYMIDHTREPGSEEAKVLGIVRQFDVPKILVINKIDRRQPDYTPFYYAQEEECDEVVEISALKGKNLKKLVNKIYQFLPEREPFVDPDKLDFPALNVTPEIFIAEIIREKAFLVMHEEIPYTLTTKVDEIKERENGVFYIKAKIITLANRYKKMLIGSNGRTIKKIGKMARKELEVITNKPVYLDLTVETNKHWPKTIQIS
jgi:GTP-binding protein Era